MKIIRIVLLIIVVGFVLVWGFSMIRIEILTGMHGDEFETLYKLTRMVDGIDKHKVMNYSKESARVYYIASGRSAGILLTLAKVDDEWAMERWDTIWSNTGSASDFLWPYIRFKF